MLQLPHAHSFIFHHLYIDLSRHAVDAFMYIVHNYSLLAIAIATKVFKGKLPATRGWGVGDHIIIGQ